jgi:hypothetical protein
MDTLYKILDVLLKALGPTAVKEYCEKQPEGAQVPEQKKIIIKKIKKAIKADTEINELCAGLEGLKIQKEAHIQTHEKPSEESQDIDELSSQLANLTLQKPKSKKTHRCDARVYGEKVFIEGTISPNGKPFAVYKHAQCETNASHCITDEDDGKLYLCKVCLKRYNSRDQFPVLWHGFFDVDDPPPTSHFLNGKWHKEKLTSLSS